MAETTVIKVLANAQQVIEALAGHGPLTQAEAAHLTGIPRSSMYRLFDGLLAAGLLAEAAEGRFGLGQRWLHLSDCAREGISEWRHADKILAELTRRTGRTSYLTVLRGEEAWCIDWARGSGIEIMLLKPGRALALYCGAAGRALLAALPEPEATAYLERAPFEALTPGTLISREALLEDMARTRAQGYALSDEDVTPGIGALGMTVPPQGGRGSAALSFGGLARDILDHQEELVFELGRAVAALAETG